MKLNKTAFPEINGLRKTKHRQVVYEVLMSHRDHPTASELFERTKKAHSDIALATVYNCLETLVEFGAIRQVNFDREPSRYCPNLEEHGHFHDANSGTIHDVTFKKSIQLEDFLNLPEGCQISDLEITIRGTIPQKQSK